MRQYPILPLARRVSTLTLLCLATAVGCQTGDAQSDRPAEGIPGEESSTDQPDENEPREPEPPEPRPEADEPHINLSELHYAQIALPDSDSHGREPEEPQLPGTIRVAAVADPVPSWISAEGRKLGGSVLQIAVDAPTLGLLSQYPPSVCTPPQPYVGSMSRSMPSGRKLVSPLSTFSSESSAVEYLKKVKARMPFYLPYRHPKARLSSGWIYSSGNSHRGQDYSRSDVPNGEDATFAVYASARGVVTDVFWTDLTGNIVVIEHTAPSGDKYLSYYGHLRNGRDADVTKALAIDCTSVTDDRCEPYKKFAQSFAGHVSWGTNDHVIAVKVGDEVPAGKFLGWAGNTGYGGAGWGLEDDGTPTSSRGNVHLHAFFGAAHPTDADTFVAVDPYGVYDKVDDKKCYDLLKDTAFDRLFAPFYPTFHGVPYEIVEHYANYYTQMGWSPRTLDVHRSSGGVRVSGVFAPGVPGTFTARGYQKLADYQATFDELFAQGLVPRHTSVTKTAGGEPRFSGLFRKAEPGESIERRSALDTEAWEDRWQTRVLDQKWRVDDYYAYTAGGEDRFSALFTSHAGRPFAFYSRREVGELKDLIFDRRAEGYVPVKVNAFAKGTGTLYAAMLRKVPGCWRTHFGLPEAQYQFIASLRAAHGYRLEHVQAHGDPARYTAVFARPDVANQAACGW